MIWLEAVGVAAALGRERRQQLVVALVAGGRVEDRAQEALGRPGTGSVEVHAEGGEDLGPYDARTAPSRRPRFLVARPAPTVSSPPDRPTAASGSESDRRASQTHSPSAPAAYDLTPPSHWLAMVRGRRCTAFAESRVSTRIGEDASRRPWVSRCISCRLRPHMRCRKGPPNDSATSHRPCR